MRVDVIFSFIAHGSWSWALMIGVLFLLLLRCNLLLYYPFIIFLILRDDMLSIRGPNTFRRKHMNKTLRHEQFQSLGHPASPFRAEVAILPNPPHNNERLTSALIHLLVIWNINTMRDSNILLPRSLA